MIEYILLILTFFFFFSLLGILVAACVLFFPMGRELLFTTFSSFWMASFALPVNEWFCYRISSIFWKNYESTVSFNAQDAN